METVSFKRTQIMIQISDFVRRGCNNKKILIIIKSSLTIIPFVFLYGSTMIELVRIWHNDPNYSHGFLIPIISLFLVWQNREKIKGLERTPARIGYIPLIFGVSLFIVGTVADEMFTRSISLLFVLTGLVLILCGKELFSKMSFPIVYLAFMVPLPYYIYNEIAVPLKLLAAKFATEILHLFSYPILREGNVLYLPNLTLEVADACSGMRSLISIIALSFAMAWIFHRAIWKRISLVAISIPIAIGVNIVRIVVTGILSYYFGKQMAEGFFHDFSGLAIFGSALIMVFGSSFLLGNLGRKNKK